MNQSLDAEPSPRAFVLDSEPSGLLGRSGWLPRNGTMPPLKAEQALRRQRLQSRLRELPPNLQTPQQSLGRFSTGCSATHGIMERCNFGCTACYLGPDANRQPPLPFDQAAAQLDCLADYLGPGGNVQLTSGEVTLLPQEDLARLVAYARQKGLSPMVMSHGDVVLHDPAYLEHLVVAGGLRKISFHVDITQRGRKGFSRADQEPQLHPVRDLLAGLLRRTRRRTGVKLKAAMTMTLNRRNLDQLQSVTDWFCANLDTFRILSLQPQAKTGRTQNDDGVTGAEAWSALEQALGLELNPHPLLFGHAECTRLAFFLEVATSRQRISFQAVRPRSLMDRCFMDAFLATFSGCNFNRVGPAAGLGQVLVTLARNPRWWWFFPFYAVRRIWQDRNACIKALKLLLSGRARIHAFAFVVHAFMDREELETPLGRERLAACAFKLAVGDRMVSMCEMNATDLRTQSYRGGHV